MKENVWDEFVGQSVAVQFKQSLMLCNTGESGTKPGALTPTPLEVATPDGAMPLQMPLLLDVTLLSIKDGVLLFRMATFVRRSEGVAMDGGELDIAVTRDSIFAITRVSKAPSNLVLPAA